MYLIQLQAANLKTKDLRQALANCGDLFVEICQLIDLQIAFLSIKKTLLKTLDAANQ